MPTNILKKYGSATLPVTVGTAQDLLRHVVPGRTLGANRRIRVIVDGQVTTPLAGVLPTLTISVIFGNQSVPVVSLMAIQSGLAAAPFQVVASIVADNSTTKQFLTVTMEDRVDKLTGQANSNRRLVQGDYAQNIVQDVPIAVTAQFNGVMLGTVSIVRRVALVEIVV